MLGLMYALIGLLALLGLTVLTLTILNSIRQRLKMESPDIRLVLLVKNQEDTVEGIIRSLFTADITRKVMSGKTFTVVDLGSSDGTVELLRKLKEYYGNFEVLEDWQKENIFLDTWNDDT